MKKWAAVEGTSAAEILHQNADPFGALSQGIVPAVVLRRQFTASQAAQLVSLLPPLTQNVSSARGEVGRWWQRNPAYATLGQDIARHGIGFPPAVMAQRSQGWEAFYQQQGLSPAIRSMHSALRELGAGRAVDTGRTAVGGVNVTLTPGLFRSHGTGNLIHPHFDTLQSHKWFARKCKGQQSGGSRATKMAADNAKFVDVYRFDRLFSAVLVLQRPEPGTDFDVSLYDDEWTDLLGDCSLVGVAHPIGVIFKSGWNERVRAKQPRSVNVRVDAGDLYIFNSNRVHELHAVRGHPPRVTFGTFVSHSSVEMRIFA